MMPRALLRFVLTIALPTALLGATACTRTAMEPNPERYVGIGVELTMEAAGARVVRVIEGGPAAEAGLQVDDVVLEVRGSPARGKSLADVVEKLRGEPGSTVKLLARTGEGNRSLTVIRRAVDNR